MIENKKLRLSVDRKGYVSSLIMKNDPYKMNWIMDNTYLKETGYQDEDKLFGMFDLTAGGEKISSQNALPVIAECAGKATVTYDFSTIKLTEIYDMSQKEDELHWSIRLENSTEKNMAVTELGIWISFAYVMFRNKDVLKNIHNSAAVFPSISKNYTKLNMVRRDGEGENLGMYQVKGEAVSVGTYCDYQNLFFENVSPSLDGMLFHKLYLAGGYPDGFENCDWIYDKSGFELKPGEEKTWEYVLSANSG